MLYNGPKLFLLNWGWLLNWVLTGLSVIVLILVLACAFFFTSNVQQEQLIKDRQAFLDQVPVVESAFNDIVQGLITVATESGDKDLAALLTNHGISLKASPPSAGSAPAAPTASKP